MVLYAPQGAGKSRAAAWLAQGCGREVVDEWDGRSPLPEGALAVTHVPPPYPVAVGGVLTLRGAEG